MESARSPLGLIGAGTPGRRAAVAALIMGGVAAVLVFGSFPICPVAIFLHRPCPGCGMTRSVIAAAHGHFAESLHHHPLGLIMGPVVAVALVRNYFGYVKTGLWGAGENAKGRFANVALIVLGLAFFGVWIARFFGAFGGPEPVG